MKIYVIHGIDKSRKGRMIKEFLQFGVELKDVNWIIGYNKHDLSDDFIKTIVTQYDSYCCNHFIPAGCNTLSKGQISCTYKHYLALQKIVESDEEYAVIMEDNIAFRENIPERLNIYISQLNKYYPDWDILFDFEWHNDANYKEGPIQEGIYVYPKSNEITNQCHGSSKCAQFYLLSKKGAKLLYDNYLPFNHAPDWYMNDLFRKHKMKVFWAEPPIGIVWKHNSTV